MINITKHKVLTNLFRYCGQFEIQTLDIFVNLKKVSMIVFNTIYIYIYMLQVSIIIYFGYIFTVIISLVMEYFIKSSSS